jgi:hypothetical protein
MDATSNEKRRFPDVAWPALAFSLWACRDLLVVWRHSPLDRFEWLAFLIWLVPIPLYWRHGIPPAYRSITLLLGIGLALTLAGIVLDTHSASHLGLIAILAAFGNRSRFAPLWWFSALAWIPLLTMATKSLPPTAIYALRISLVLLGTTAVLLSPAPRTPAPPTPTPTP